MAPTRVRITYATMSADNEDLHSAYEKGLETARSWLGQKHPFYVNGEPREGEAYDEERSPIDRDVLIGYFARATRQSCRARSCLALHSWRKGIGRSGSQSRRS